MASSVAERGSDFSEVLRRCGPRTHDPQSAVRCAPAPSSSSAISWRSACLRRRTRRKIDSSGIPDSLAAQLKPMRRISRPPLGDAPRQLSAIRLDADRRGRRQGTDWAALSPSTLLSVRSTLRRCLEKDPRRRLRDIGEDRLALDAANDPVRCRRQKPRPIARAPAAIAVRAAPFDPAHPALTSTDATVLENVHFDVETEIAPWLAVSNSGTAVYAPKQPGADLVGVARPGGKDRIVGLGAGWLPGIKRISPDSTKAAVRHGLNLGFMTCSAASTSRAAVVNALGGASRVHFRRLSPDHFQERLRIARPMKFDLRGRPVDLLKVFGG